MSYSAWAALGVMGALSLITLACSSATPEPLPTHTPAPTYTFYPTSSSGYRYTFVLKHDPADWPYYIPGSRSPEERLAHGREAQRARREQAKKEGRCTQCENPPDLEKTLCTLHIAQRKEHNRKYSEANRDKQDFKNRINQRARERREKAREAGLCTVSGCKSQPAEGRLLCDLHLLKLKESNQRRRDRGISEEARLRAKELARAKSRKRHEEAKSGIRCLKCEDPPTPGKIRCDPCQVLHRGQSKESDAKRKARAEQLGLCSLCFKQPPREGRAHCQPCAYRSNEDGRQRRARRKAAGLPDRAKAENRQNQDTASPGEPEEPTQSPRALRYQE